MSAGPSLQSIRIEPGGRALCWRVLLPPNLAQCAPRDRVPVKLEAACGGEILSPEKLSPVEPYWAEPPHLLAALLIESWNSGRLPGMMQLSRDQLRQLLQPLSGEPAVYSFKAPRQPLDWENGVLPGVHEHLDPAPAAKTLPGKASEARAPSVAAPARRAVRRAQRAEAPARDFSPMVVDGSTQFLAITLPSRESVAYAEALELVKQHGFKLEPSNRQWWLRDRHATLAFLAAHHARLRDHFRAEFTDNFQQRAGKLRHAAARVDVRADGEDYIAEARLEAPGVDERTLAEALIKGQPYVEGPRGLVLLGADALEQVAEAQRRLSGDPGRLPAPRARRKLRPEEAATAQADFEELDIAVEAPEEWKRRSGALADLGALAVPPRGELHATLRPYQALGAAWLWHLFRSRLGGILADEMGLGKTVQALALIAAVCDRRTGATCLVVCPAGLVENWRREAAKFAPGLSVFAHHGARRLEQASEAAGRDLVITSYGTLTRDAALFHAIDFALVVGDEAQHVKNRQTRNARALRGLQARRRFLLTGTPVENSHEDLRALFEFLLPGYLGKPPPGLSRDERAWHAARLRDRAAPYILRRAKRDVAPELPEKIEQTLYCEMGEAQAALYRKVEERARREVFELEMANASEGRLRVAAFQQLLRLRQACVDPRLLPEGDEADAVASAKLDAFTELLAESLDGGHRLLVFSQFTAALALLRAELDAQQVPYLYLDGKTKNRAALCERFNDDPAIPVFLISLKAGGTGLNLTGADTVVHYDPWWNPAVEAQATDRAHRIGQTRTVTSYKLIVSGSVEERVLDLQREKAALLQDLFEASDAANAGVAFADLKSLLEA